MDLPIDIHILIYILVLAVVLIVLYSILFFKKISNVLDHTSKSIEELSKNVSSTLNSIDADISVLREKTVASLDNIDKLTNNLDEISKKLNVGVERTFRIVEPVENLVNNTLNKVEPPVTQLATFISASSKAINTFLNFLRSKKK